MDNQAPLSPADVRRRPTVMLAQLLRDFDAPRVIDYLCVSSQPPRAPPFQEPPLYPRGVALRKFSHD